MRNHYRFTMSVPHNRIAPRFLLLVATVVAACLTGCNSNTSSSAHMSQAHAQQQYLSAVKPLNGALNTFAKTADASPSSVAQVQKETAPLFYAFGTYDAILIRDAWPISSQTAVQSLLTDDTEIRSDIDSLKYVSSSSAYESWQVQLARDVAVAQMQASIVRHGLGLSPAPAVHDAAQW